MWTASLSHVPIDPVESFASFALGLSDAKALVTLQLYQEPSPIEILGEPIAGYRLRLAIPKAGVDLVCNRSQFLRATVRSLSVPDEVMARWSYPWPLRILELLRAKLADSR